ncbi:MAG: flagellar hook-basal body complex protein FliE [Blautia sp.]|nr:flagellar hook-basal body complex protein FliE [Blautia sp.]
MDLSTITGISGLTGSDRISSVSSLTGTLAEEREKTTGTLFESFLNTAIDNIRTTNGYLSDAEDEKLRFAMGETENTHDLMIAMQKASTALQYTVAIRDKLLEAYKEIMQMQI